MRLLYEQAIEFHYPEYVDADYRPLDQLSILILAYSNIIF